MRRVVVPCVALLSLLLAQALPPHAHAQPTLIYCTSVNDQPTVRTGPARFENGGTFAGVYYDPTVGGEGDVTIPGSGAFFGDTPRTTSGGFASGLVDNRADMACAPAQLLGTILDEAWAAPGEHGFVNSSVSTRTWYVLRGARAPVRLRADVAFQGAVYGDGPAIDADGSSFFTNALSTLSHAAAPLSDTVIAVNGRAQPAGVPCGPWDLHGTLPDFCAESDGTPQVIDWVIRSNPFVVLPDVPFRLSLGLNAAAIASPFSVPVRTYARFDRATLGKSTDLPATPGLVPEGFVVDDDGDPSTRDVRTLTSLGYRIEALPEDATFVSLAETAHDESRTVETVVERRTSASLAATGALSGDVTVTDLSLATIATGDYAGKGFFSADWTAVLGGVAQHGVWRGFSYERIDEGRVYLKGVLSGTIDATAEGYLTETTAGSGVLDQVALTWALDSVAGQAAGGRVELAGSIAPGAVQTHRATPLRLAQLSATGATSGAVAAAIGMVVTSVRVDRADHPLAGQGFALLSWQSAQGTGEAWAHALEAAPGVFALGGMAAGPLSGPLHVALDESGALQAISGYVRRTDRGLPPMADVEVRAWSTTQISPGDEFTIYLEYRNRGRIAASNVRIVDRLSQMVEHVAGGTHDPFTHYVTFDVGTLAPGARGSRTIRARARWGLFFVESVVNQAFVETATPEVDAVLAPDRTALTPEWWALQVARGNCWDARLTPPGFDPSKPEWAGLQPDSLKRRVEQGIFLAKERDPRWGEYLQHLYDQGKIHIDLDLSSSEWNGVVGHMYLRGDDIGWGDSRALQVSDARWSAEGYSAARLPNLSGILIHEGRHSDGQLVGGSEKGELQAFSAEGAHQLKVLNELVRAGRTDDARALIAHSRFRWGDLANRKPPLGPQAAALSHLMQARLDAILASLDAGRTGEALRMIAEYQADLVRISASRNDPIANASEHTTSFDVAWDPNAKYGPEGPVARGQRLDYRVEYENVGKGRAHGVYVTDELPAALDEATLAIGPMLDKKTGAVVAPAGIFDAATRTITWQVGTVAPAAGGSSSLSVNVRGDAADGAEIVNYATVHFPSVPQVLPTNPIVSVVTPPGQSIAPVFGPVRLWAGLKNSDDQGTGFDFRAELYAGDVLIAAGEARCISGLTRNAARARRLQIPLAATPAGSDVPATGSLLELRVLARIGTTPDGQRCPKTSHTNARGVRLYYDGVASRSHLALALGGAGEELYLRAVAGDRVLDQVAPDALRARTADSAGLRVLRGNPWRSAGAWEYLVP
ncbi:DUF11 domain-containing protein [Candidatus Binatia bacterium]|nr:DUF11 domain-containing protein [Candidatus Binatia bacterium]